MLFQKHAWVDTPTMKTLANDFINHVKERHNCLGVLLLCDNLAAHASDEVTEIFHKGNVFYDIFRHAQPNLCNRIYATYRCGNM